LANPRPLGSSGPQTIGVGDSPFYATYDDENGLIYVSNRVSNNVSVLNGTTVVGSVEVGIDPSYPTYDRGNGYVYVPDESTYNVSVINGTKIIATVPVGGYPFEATYDSGNGYVYVSIPGSGTSSSYVAIINGTQNIGSVKVGIHPTAAAYDAQNGYLYVVDSGDCVDSGTCLEGNVSVINGTAGSMTIAAGNGPDSATYDPANGFVYVTNLYSGVTVIDGTAVVGSVSGGTELAYSVYDPVNGYVYVTGAGSDNVTVIDGTSVLGSINVGSAPGFASWDSWNDYLFVSNSASSNVSVINGSTLLGSVDVGDWPGLSAFDPSNGYMYVPNSLSGTVTAIPPLHSVTFAEKGLPSATNWSVDLGGDQVNSTSSNVTFVETDGNYSFVLEAGGEYQANPSSGSITVNGTDLTVSVSFAPSTGLSLNISAMPSRICVNRTSECGAGSGVTRVTLTAFALGSGTVIAAEGASGPLFQFVPYANFSIVPNQTIVASCVTAAGSRFEGCAGTPAMRNVSGVEVLGWNWSNIPARNEMAGGSSWTVSFELYSSVPRPVASSVDACVTFVCKLSGSSTVKGLFTWADYSNPLNTTARLQSFPPSMVLVEPIWSTYPVTFAETGLPPESGWWANTTGGSSTYSEATTLTFREPNGTYAYSVADAERTFSSPGGSFTVNGRMTNVSVLFLLVTYRVTFTEVGLSPGTLWSVALGDLGVSNSSQSSTISVGVPNGTFRYHLETVPGWTTPNFTGQLTVDGAPDSQTVTWTPVTYTMTFIEIGLPSGTRWSVTLNGLTESGTGDLTFPKVANGSYQFAVGATSGYSESPKNGTLVVSGPPFPWWILFASTSATFLGLPTTEGYTALGGLIVLIAVAAASLLVYFRKREACR
jgi:YVTN family beta-propeller protein